MDHRYLVVFITAPTRDMGRQIAHALVKGRLAACVNVLPAMDSIYRWAGKVHDEQEVLLVVKTRADLFPALVPAVQALHPYDVPEIIALPILEGHAGYLEWIDSATVDLDRLE